MTAVAYVVLNRMQHPSFPDTACGVVYQKRTVKGKVRCEFPWACGALPTKLRSPQFEVALEVARKVIRHDVANPVGKSLFFHERSIKTPRFSHRQEFVATIGNHRFFGISN